MYTCGYDTSNIFLTDALDNLTQNVLSPVDLENNDQEN